VLLSINGQGEKNAWNRYNIEQGVQTAVRSKDKLTFRALTVCQREKWRWDRGNASSRVIQRFKVNMTGRKVKITEKKQK